VQISGSSDDQTAVRKSEPPLTPAVIILTIAGAQVSQWTASCLENCIKKLTGLNKPFKYVVTCVIMQKNGEGRVAEGCVGVGCGHVRHHAEEQ